MQSLSDQNFSSRLIFEGHLGQTKQAFCGFEKIEKSHKKGTYSAFCFNALMTS